MSLRPCRTTLPAIGNSRRRKLAIVRWTRSPPRSRPNRSAGTPAAYHRTQATAASPATVPSHPRRPAPTPAGSRTPRSARRTRKSEAQRTNDESSSKAQFAACGLGLAASRFSDRCPKAKSQNAPRQSTKWQEQRTKQRERLRLRLRSRLGIPCLNLNLDLDLNLVLCTSSFVLGAPVLDMRAGGHILLAGRSQPETRQSDCAL